MQVREARDTDIEGACAVLEAAFRRPEEARLFRSLWEGDDLAVALVAVGPIEDKVDPGVLAGAATPPGLPTDRRDRLSTVPGGAGQGETPEGPVIGVAVLAHLHSPEGAVGLGPLAVRPDCSDRGIGKALIAASVERARHDRARAIFVLGQPAYYTRFGFSVEAARPFTSPYPAEFLMALELEEGALEGGGELRYPPAYAGL
ncbi:MAG TPA: GNAT family N-acetyltransferase [Paracoccaceae bacterium]|nr:GNAT family N-acetyltransferase [Paracoccaceae bacterium]